ncbi:hypothetical protein KAU33_04580 [Candidatus Dependentiae bacterium]|nr:hypothetical protein [Candidatus Dependentiae bacterium]
MIKSIMLVLVILLAIPTSVQAQDELPNPGITPDNILYPVDVFFDDVRLVFTFGEEAKFNKQLQIAEERLAEAQVMNRINNTEATQKAVEEHARIMEQVQVRVNVSDNLTENLKLQLQMEEKLRIHEEKMLHVNTEFTSENQGLMSGTTNQTGLLKEDVQQEKNRLMEEIDNSDQVECDLKSELGIGNGDCS